MLLTTSLAEVLRTTQKHIEALASMNIRTVGDLILYLPRSHEDLSTMQTLASAPLEEKSVVQGTVSAITLVRTRNGKRLVKALFTDNEGNTAEVVWFNQPHIKRMLGEGDEVVLTGKLSEQGWKLVFMSPQFERAGARPLIHAGHLVPIYPAHDVITTRWLREKMMLIRDALMDLPETLPEDVLAEEHLLSRRDAIRALHFPEDPAQVQRAQERMAFEEMFRLQEQALTRRREWQGTREERLRVPMHIELIRAFFSSLNFTPTGSQKIAIFEILRDMEKDQPMSRLLEGDVGSGKTLVAVAVMANLLKSGGQCALMVPTEVLARQHAGNIARLLVNFHTFLEHSGREGLLRLPTVALLTGSTPAVEAEDIRRSIATGTTDIAIGTHALIEDSVHFRDLRLVIVDEQHRFGVLQRERLKEKGNPHFLSMTATPIPRTLALTAYGEHNLSVLTEKPGRRQKIHTEIVPPMQRKTVELFIDREIERGGQVFVICPLILESKELDDVRNVEREVLRLREEFPQRRIARLHGRLKPSEKQEIMQAFRDRKDDILVSTSVIEVGIDVPNATIILIEGAERFGLSQLHQLRGRVGRSDDRSYCFLFTSTPEQARSERLHAMEKHDSGFLLAEIDLKLRGPGELFGLRQSGLPDMHVGTLLNPELVVKARRAAEKYLGLAPEKMA